MTEFQEFPSITRLSRQMIVTEKLDGTNAQIYIEDDFVTLHAGSRSRWLTPEADNFGFARWCQENKEELLKLGPGRHFGEWWGQGIQRRYGLTEKRFSLFNVGRWTTDPSKVTDKMGLVPNCCSVVPVMFDGLFDTYAVDKCLESLEINGSVAAPGFMNPEGVVVFHVPSGTPFKKTLDKNDGHKSI